MKHCTDCKYVFMPLSSFPRCTHPRMNQDNGEFAATGELRDANSCRIARTGNRLVAFMLGTCGMHARFFEPKDAP